MTEEIVKQNIDCQSQYNKNTRVELSINLSTAYAIIQGMQFVLEHKKLFEKDGTECEDCFQSIDASQKALGEIIEAIQEHHEDHLN